MINITIVFCRIARTLNTLFSALIETQDAFKSQGEAKAKQRFARKNLILQKNNLLTYYSYSCLVYSQTLFHCTTTASLH